MPRGMSPRMWSRRGWPTGLNPADFLCDRDVAPGLIMCETFGTGKVSDDLIERLVREHFDLRPAAIIHNLDSKRPIYRQTAAYGHFGRDDLDVPWERTDKAAALAAAAGLT